MIFCIPAMLNPHSSFLIMTSCLWPSFPWHIYFRDLLRLSTSGSFGCAPTFILFLSSSAPDPMFTLPATLDAHWLVLLRHLLFSIKISTSLLCLLCSLGENLYTVLVISKVIPGLQPLLDISATQKAFCVFIVYTALRVYYKLGPIFWSLTLFGWFFED